MNYLYLQKCFLIFILLLVNLSLAAITLADLSLREVKIKKPLKPRDYYMLKRANPQLVKEFEEIEQTLKNNKKYKKNKKNAYNIPYYERGDAKQMLRYFQTSCKESVEQQTKHDLAFNDTSYLDFNTCECSLARDMAKRFNEEQEEAIEQYRTSEAELYEEQDYKNYIEIEKRLLDEHQKISSSTLNNS